MSLENEEQRSLDNACKKFDVVLKKPAISYPREFLLSLSNLDVCKKLPSEFDESLLSELEDASQSIPDRPRISGSLPPQGFRRNEYGSSPPTQGGSGSYSRGSLGKWESRSSGWSDRDNDSQSDKDSDSGRRFGHQSRRSWQTQEHDGLLGSGSFPRPPGYAAGIDAPKVRANAHYQLSKSNEPYHPPRPYKALPHSRRDTDSYNDETFGSMECTGEDRAEEERKRRASFETMRKEQQKALQEKQKLNMEKHKEAGVSDPGEVLDDSKEEKELFVRNNEMDVSAALPIMSNDSEKSFASNSPASRPLVPPGFKNNILDKSSDLKALSQTPLSEVFKPLIGVSLLDAETKLVQNGIKGGLERQISKEIGLVDGQPGEKIQHARYLDKDKNLTLSSSLDVPMELDMDDQFPLASSHLDSNRILDDAGTVKLEGKVLEDKTVGNSNRTYSTSILENLLGSSLSMNDCSPSSTEHHNSKPDDTWSSNSVQSSKFVQWFLEEESKPAGRPNDLPSLIVSGDKGRYQVSDTETAEHFPPFSFKALEQVDKLELDMPSTTNGISDHICINNEEGAVPTVLTCEDLEQSILSEYSSKNTNMQPVLQTSGANAEQPSGHVDGHASLHLLSLLHRGTDQSNTNLNSGLDINLSGKLLVSRETVHNEPKCEENSTNIPNSVTALTLETFFGTAFMKELQSVEAPVSVHRGSAAYDRVDGPGPHGFSFPVTDHDNLSPTIVKIGLQGPSHDCRVLASNNKQQTKLSKANNWRRFDDSQTEITSLKHYTEAVPKNEGLQGVSEFQLPEERVSGTDPLHHWMSTFLPYGSSSNNANSSSDGPIDIVAKIATINTAKDQQVMVGTENLQFTRGPHEQLEPEIPHRSVQMQQLLPHFQPSQVAQARHLYHHLEPHPVHMSSQMKFMGPASMFNHDSPASHQFPSNINRPPFPHPSVKIAGFEVPSHRSSLHQQMQMPGTHPPYIVPDFSSLGPTPSSHYGNQATAFIQETNQMQSFPYGPHASTVVSHGVPIPASNINSGGNPPESFQRQIEMELRANSKQTPPFAPGYNQGTHGHEVDMGLRYQ